MTLKVRTLRLSDEDIQDLERLTEELKEDAASLTRKALRIGISELRLRAAVEMYREGAISFGRLSEVTGLGHWRLYDELRRRGVEYIYGEERLEEEIRKLVG